MRENGQFILDVNDELIVDNFAGGGGASTGIELALGRHVDHAINHDWAALGMHRINHPQTVHHCEDVFDINPAALTKGRRVGLGWFSPDCKHFSKAKGGRPVDKKIRGLVLVIFRWALIHTRVIAMENVEEIQTWGPLLANGKPDPAHKGRTWLAFKAAMTSGLDPEHPDIPEMLDVLGASVTKAQLVQGFGYDLEVKEIRASALGVPTIRKRLFMIARCDGRPIVWPADTHANPAKDFIPRAERSGRHASGLKPWRIVAECIDWDIPCRSIFLTKAEARRFKCRRPLVKATLRRVATGMDRYVLKAKKPFLVSLTHQGGDRVEAIDEPVRTLTGAHRGEKALVDATVAGFSTEHANASTQRTFPIDEPLRTQCAQVKGGHFSLVSANLMQKGHYKSNSQMVKGADEPMRTQATRGEHALVTGTLVGAGGPVYAGKPKPLDVPMNTLTAENHTSLVTGTLVGCGGRAGQSRPRALNEPNHTMTAKADTCLAAASLVKLRGDAVTHAPGQPADEPAHTISAGGTHHGVSVAHLAAYYGSEEDGQPVDEALRTISTKPRFGLALSEAVAPVMTADQVAGAHRVAKFLRSFGVEFEGEFATVGGFVIVDIGMRMLTPRELFRAQGFGDNYVIDRAWVVNPKSGEIVEVRLTKEQQIRMCGNSVCPPVAAAIVAANVPELCLRSATTSVGVTRLRAKKLRSDNRGGAEAQRLTEGVL